MHTNHDDNLIPVHHGNSDDRPGFDPHDHYLVAIDHFHANYVERPVQHTHDNSDHPAVHFNQHDHDGTALLHTHNGGTVYYSSIVYASDAPGDRPALALVPTDD